MPEARFGGVVARIQKSMTLRPDCPAALPLHNVANGAGRKPRTGFASGGDGRILPVLLCETKMIAEPNALT